MLFGILEDPHLGRPKHQPVVVMQLNLRLKTQDYCDQDQDCNNCEWGKHLWGDSIAIDENSAVLLTGLDKHLVQPCQSDIIDNDKESWLI